MQPGSTAPRRYRVGDIEFEPDRGYIRRGGRDVYLRQQSFAMLMHLFEHRDRLVTKDELHSAIWGDVAVGDDAIVQCIADIRRALGDDSKAPRYIRTVPKLGYRFVGTVQEIEADSADPAPAPAAAPPPNTSEPVPARDAEWRSARPALVAVLVAALAIYGGLRLWQARASAERPAKRVLVLDFENKSGNQELAWLRHGLADMIITDLSRFSGSPVVSRQERDELLSRRQGAITLTEALSLAAKANADLLVLGSFASLGDAVRIEVSLHDAATGRLVGADPATAERPSQIFTQAELLSLKLARRLGWSPATSGGSISQVMTNNLEAYRYYSLGLARSQELKNAEAIELFQKALELDPGFAMAHARIGYTYAVRHGVLDRAKPHLQRAFEHPERLTDRERLHIAAWYAIASQDYDEAIAQCRAILDRYPDDVEVATRLVTLLQGESRLGEARDVALQAYSTNSEDAQLVNALGGTYSLLGRHTEAIAMFERYVALAPGEANPYDSLGLAHQWAGRYDEAIAAYRKSIELDPEFEIPIVHLGNTYYQLGRYRDAIREYERYVKAADFDQDRIRGLSSIVNVHLHGGDIHAAEATIRRAEAFGFDLSWDRLWLALHQRNKPAAEALVRTVERRNAGRGAGVSRRFNEYVRGQFALLAGRTDEGLTYLRSALSHPVPTYAMDPLEEALAAAYLRLGRLDEAAAEFERVLRINPNFPMARYGLAVALDRKGQAARARAEYETFLRLWKDADRDAPALVDAKRRLAALTGSRRSATGAD